MPCIIHVGFLLMNAKWEKYNWMKEMGFDLKYTHLVPEWDKGIPRVGGVRLCGSVCIWVRSGDKGIPGVVGIRFCGWVRALVLGKAGGHCSHSWAGYTCCWLRIWGWVCWQATECGVMSPFLNSRVGKFTENQRKPFLRRTNHFFECLRP